jgi:hypothetical protein
MENVQVNDLANQLGYEYGAGHYTIWIGKGKWFEILYYIWRCDY